jgi:hypothetical protein
MRDDVWRFALLGGASGGSHATCDPLGGSAFFSRRTLATVGK